MQNPEIIGYADLIEAQHQAQLAERDEHYEKLASRNLCFNCEQHPVWDADVCLNCFTDIVGEGS